MEGAPAWPGWLAGLRIDLTLRGGEGRGGGGEGERTALPEL